LSFTIDFEIFKEFWDRKPYVVLDTNVILDLYRTSSYTTEDVLKNLNEVFENIWIPFQVLDEFMENQKEVKQESYNKYHNVSKDISSLIKKFNNELSNKFKRYGKFQFPKIHELRKIIEVHMNAIEKEAKEFRNKIKDEIEKNRRLLREDPIMNFMKKIEEEGHVGEPYSSRKLLKIFQEGERRYFYQLPPGYEDVEKNKSDKTNRKQFGDLIIWKSILEKARDSMTPILFITEDRKGDWWHLDENGEIIEPRKELIAEFDEYVESKGNFMMLPLFEFIKHISVINKLSALHAEIELDAESICMTIFEHHESDIKQNLESRLIHGGQLDGYLTSGSLRDVEILELISKSLDISNVDFDGNAAYIEGDYNIKISAGVEEYFSNESKIFDIELHGDFYVELGLDFENNNYSVTDFNISNSEVIEATETYSDFIDMYDLCDVCGRKQGDYELYKYGSICDDCLGRGGFFVCTNCGTVYYHEDYIGDGETCQRCS